MREKDAELRGKICGLRGCQKGFAETWKRVARCVDWCRFDVTVRADLWDRPLSREELLAMAVKTRGVFGKLSDVRKRSVSLANLLPIFRRNLMTRATREILFADVGAVRKARVIRARLCASLGGCLSAEQSNSKYQECCYSW